MCSQCQMSQWITGVGRQPMSHINEINDLINSLHHSAKNHFLRKTIKLFISGTFSTVSNKFDTFRSY